ncbi:hypothetical protein ATCC90586_009443 [Pythium insidiosum]|nr:hypothetical protein ATCC90586_009443 [Pythium insidiosum]
MSGSGRKSAYRKGVTNKVLHGNPEPQENEQIVRVIALRGGNLFEVQDADGATSLTMLPAKFRKLIWVKRGDFLIVASSDNEVSTAEGKKGAVTSIVEHILYKDQIKNLRTKGLWPQGFDDMAATQESAVANAEPEEDASTQETNTEQKGTQMVMSDPNALFVNRNRRRGIIEDEEEEEEEEED